MVLLSEVVQTGILADFWYDVVVICFADAQCFSIILIMITMLFHSIGYTSAMSPCTVFLHDVAAQHLCTMLSAACPEVQQ